MVASYSQAAVADNAAAPFPTATMLAPNPAPQPLSHETTTRPEPVSTAVPSDVFASSPATAYSAPEAERRQLTVMFCDLADSTRLSQQLDAEDLREVVRAYQTTAADVIHHYAGHIAQYLGDGLLIYFGWPVAHEDDAHRALHAGLGIVEAVTTTLNPRLQREKGVQLTVRLGIHTGPVVVGAMGGGGRHEHLAMGDTVNIAARLEGLAQPNTVVISQVTARLVRDAFALEDLGAQVLKGVSQPMQVFRVLGTLTAHEDDTGAAGTPFLVGRDEEVGLLLRRWEQSKAGLGQVALLSGEAGIGKSSLVAIVRQHVAGAGYTRLTFRCSPYHTNSALYPVIAHIQRLLHWQPDDSPGRRLDTLERVLAGYSRPLEEVVPLYAALLAVPMPEGRYPALHLTPQQQRQQTQEALVGWLLEAAERHPTLAMWEDLHWADPSTLELLGLVLEQTPTVSMLHVLTYRPEFVPPWPTRSHMTPITLNRLERPQVEALITHLAGGKALPAEVVQHIVAKTDGVPLYVEELTKMLLTSALLREEGDRYVLTGPLSTSAIPGTLQDSLMARLDQMQTAKEVAQLGAVIGREFSYDLLQAVAAHDASTLQAELAQLVEAELLYQRGRPPRARYLFKHALIQDAAYQSLLKSARQQVHQQIAQVLETQFSDTVETHPEMLAQHYTAAGVPAQAVPYWHRAGQRAFARAAYHEVLHHVSRGLDLLATLAETPERVQREIDLQLMSAQVLQAMQGSATPEVEQIYTRVRTLCARLGDMPQLYRVLRGLAAFYSNRAEHRIALETMSHMWFLAQQLQEAPYLLMTHYGYGGIFFYHGEFTRAREHLEQAITLSDALPDHAHPLLAGFSNPGMHSRSYLGYVLWMLGYPAQALQRNQEAVTMAQALSHPLTLDFMLRFAARMHVYLRDVQAALTQARAAVAFSAERGSVHGVASGSILLGWGLAMQEQTAEGIAQMRQGLEGIQATGAKVLRSEQLAILAEAYGKAGQVHEGLTCLAEAVAFVQSTGERFWEAEIYRLKGALLLMQSADNHDQAEACFHQALDIARPQHAKSLELRAATSLARLWQSQGKRQDAYELLAPVYNWFTEGFDTADLQEAKTLLAMVSGAVVIARSYHKAPHESAENFHAIGIITLGDESCIETVVYSRTSWCRLMMQQRA
jgi:class 3 adenylate cyclase/tetratricopeptide (TPR) repeat protein